METRASSLKAKEQTAPVYAAIAEVVKERKGFRGGKAVINFHGHPKLLKLCCLFIGDKTHGSFNPVEKSQKVPLSSADKTDIDQAVEDGSMDQSPALTLASVVDLHLFSTALAMDNFVMVFDKSLTHGHIAV
ncbi:hypothetical protein Q9233_003997 [Columba guinea]|nr:hypothetical protein Q9233_003997 [Columba guinea]